MKKTKLLFLMLLLVVSIGMQAQSTCEANGVTWKFYADDGKATITGETQGASAFHGALNIPSTVQLGSQSYPVYAINHDAFNGYQGATSITIPDNIEVGTSAFGNCANVENLTLGNNVRGTDYGFFSGCSKLNSTNIHYSSGELKDIIETGLLSGLNWITGNVEIPEGATEIGQQCFANCTELTNVTIPASVQKIGANSFRNCTSLTNVTIPGSVKTIGASAFQGCTNLSSVTLNEGLEVIGGGAWSSNIFYGAFQDCTALTSITIPASVKHIEPGAFSGCI